MTHFIVARFDRETALGLELTIALAIIAVSLWGFVTLAGEFPETGALQSLDLRVVAWMHRNGTETGQSVFWAISWFGYGGLAVFGIVVPLIFAIRKEWLRVVVWLAGVIGAATLNYDLKLAFRRMRPEFADTLLLKSSFSFPSGHAMMSLVAYGLLAYFLLERLQNRAWRYPIIGITVVVIALVGYSRLYLGVHYVSDVTAGFLAGGAWLWACILAYQLARGRRPG